MIFCPVGWTRINTWHIKLIPGIQSSYNTIFCGNTCYKKNVWTRRCCSCVTSPWRMEGILNERALCCIFHLRKGGAWCINHWMNPQLLHLLVEFLRAKCWQKNKICGSADTIEYNSSLENCGLLCNSVTTGLLK